MGTRTDRGTHAAMSHSVSGFSNEPGHFVHTYRCTYTVKLGGCYGDKHLGQFKGHKTEGNAKRMQKARLRFRVTHACTQHRDAKPTLMCINLKTSFKFANVLILC